MATDKQTLTIDLEAHGLRLDRFLREVFPNLQQSLIEKMLRKGEVRINGEKAKASHRLQRGESLTYPPFIDNLKPADAEMPLIKPLTPEEKSQLTAMVLFEDEDVIILNKPSGLATQGGSKIGRSVDQMMTLAYPDAPPRLVHRLDKDTSGVLVLAKTRGEAQRLTEAFKAKTVRKTYWAVVVGTPANNEGTIKLPLTKTMIGKAEKVRVNYEEGLPAVTHYHVLEKLEGDLTLLELSPETGRTHQLRVHCTEGLGTPILGDGKYGGKLAKTWGRVPLHLHAYQISLPTKDGSASLTVKAPLPEHFKEIIS